MKNILSRINSKLLGSDAFCIRSDFDYDFFYEIKQRANSGGYAERSFAQYRCQFKGNNDLFLYVVMLVFIPMLLFIPLIMFVVYNTKKTPVKNGSIIAVLPSKEVIPQKCLNRGAVSFLNKGYRKNFNLKDLWFCYKFIFQYLLFPYFWLKCLYVVNLYSGIAKLDSKEVLVSNEYSFTSSVLTGYLNAYGKTCSNCMHGEKALCLRDCFSTYDNFYIWDDFYIKVLEKMDVQANFIVSSCSALNLNLNISEQDGDILFFLQGIESVENLEVIRRAMKILSGLYGGKFFVKPHPRYKNMNINMVFHENEILNLSFEDALEKCKIVASNYSTVLFQTYISKKIYNSRYPIIVVNDTIKLPPMYIMREKADILFSDILAGS